MLIYPCLVLVTHSTHNLWQVSIDLGESVLNTLLEELPVGTALHIKHGTLKENSTQN